MAPLPAHEENAEAATAWSKIEDRGQENAEAAVALASVSLPAAAIRRIARSAAPGARFSGESVAALHRVAQVFVCYLTDRSLHEMKVEGDKLKKSKKNPAMPKTLRSDHVMRFLSSELPPIAKKVSTLFPFAVPPEYKPSGVRLLERLHEQERLANLGKDNDSGGNSLLSSFGTGQQSDPQGAPDEPPLQLGVKRLREEGKEKPAKRTKAEKAPKPAPKPKAAPAKLSAFFGAKDSRAPAAAADALEQADTCAQPEADTCAQPEE